MMSGRRPRRRARSPTGVPRRSGPGASRTRAAARRPARRTRPAAAPRRTCRSRFAYSGTNAKKPAIPHGPSSTSTPGKEAGRVEQPEPTRFGLAGRGREHGRCRLGHRSDRHRGHDRERGPPRSTRASKPDESRTVSPIGGPSASPMYSASDARLNASRSGPRGARSLAAASIATKKNASAAPSIARATMNRGSDRRRGGGRGRRRTAAPRTRAAVAGRSGPSPSRRPAGAAASRSRTPRSRCRPRSSSASSGPSANCEATGRTALLAVKKARPPRRGRRTAGDQPVAGCPVIVGSNPRTSSSRSAAA